MLAHASRPHQREPGEQPGKAQRQRGGDIERRRAQRPALDQQRELEAEGGKGGEAAEHADAEQQPPALARRAVPRQPAGEQPHGEAAERR